MAWLVSRLVYGSALIELKKSGRTDRLREAFAQLPQIEIRARNKMCRLCRRHKHIILSPPPACQHRKDLQNSRQDALQALLGRFLDAC